MDGFKRQLVLASCLAAVAIIAMSASSPVFAQECHAGNPCDQFDTASHSAVGPGTGANNPIDIVTGNKYQAEIDFNLPGELALAFTRHYNSISVQGGAFGGGWSHTYETVLTRSERRKDGQASATIAIVQADGRRLEFRASSAPHNGVQRYISVPFGYGVIDEDIASIDQLRTGSARVAPNVQPWRWTWADGRRLSFDARGTLKRVQTASGEWLTLEHDKHNRLVLLTDFAGRELRFSYWDHPSEWLPAFGSTGERAGASKGRLKSVRLPDGRTIEYGYDTNGLLAEARFPDGTRKRYEYVDTDGALRLARIIDRAGRVEGTYSYDSNGWASSSAVADAANAVHIRRVEPQTTHELGLTTLTNAAGASTSYRWQKSTFGYQLVEARGPGCSTCPVSNVRYSYNESGLVERIEKLAATTDGAAEIEWSELIARDSVGRLVERHREQNGVRKLVERYEYANDDPLAKPMRIVRPSVAPGSFHILELSYNARGQPLSLNESGYAPFDSGLSYAPISRSTSFSYYEIEGAIPHLVGRLKSIDGPLPGEIDRILYRYDERGLLSQIVHSPASVETFTYDTLGRLKQYIPLDGVAVELEYDSEGRVASYARAGLRTRLAYDANGRISELHDPIGQQFSFEYDAASRLRSIADSDNNRIEIDLDDEGRAVVRRLRNPDGTIAQERSIAPSELAEISQDAQPFSPAALSFIRLPMFKNWKTSADALIAPALAQHLPHGRQEVLDERGLASHYLYDDFSRLVHAFNPDSGPLTLEYDEASRVIARLFADSRAVGYTYDALGRVTTIEAGIERVSIEYGPYNKPERISYSWGDERFEYDFAGRLIAREQRIGNQRFVRSYRYDALGRLSEAKLPDGETLIYRYNASVHAKPGVLTSIERKGLFSSSFIVHGLNEREDQYNRQTSRFGNGLEFVRELDVSGGLRRFGTADVAMFEFDGDEHGRITAVRDGSQREITYDIAGRFKEARLSAAGSNSIEVGSVSDPAGNARIISFEGRHALLRIDAASNRIVARSESKGREIRYAYDAEGRTTTIGARRFEYDAFGRLARISDDGRPIAEYLYNAFGERIRKVLYAGSKRSVTYFFYDGSKLTAEADESGRITKQFVYIADRLVAMLHGKHTYAMHTDWRGTPVAATDDDQHVVWRARVDALGRIESQQGAFTVDLRASNQYFERESGLHYNTHRYFDPSTSRYLTPDPIGQLGGLNLYAFAGGDPINFIDPAGLQAIPADWGNADRLRFMFEETIRQLPDALQDAIGEALRDLISPAGIATTVGIFVAWGIAQLTPFGWAADLLIVGIGFAFMGAAIVELARGTVAAHRAMRDARSLQDLCAAGENFAQALANAAIELGGGAALGGATLAAARAGGRQISRQLRRMFGGSERAPPPGPLLWTQEMAQRVRDGFGNQIRQFMAGRNHMWRTQAERLRWQSLEDAATSFARNYFHARYVFNVKHLNGVLDHPRATQGFDLVFVKPDGTLVIGEAKSRGRMDRITAFGGGENGVGQLNLNLSVLRTRVESDETIPESVRASILRQIDERTFETQLYIPPTTTIPNGLLDVFQEMLGRPLDGIYILPETLPARD